MQRVEPLNSSKNPPETPKNPKFLAKTAGKPQKSVEKTEAARKKSARFQQYYKKHGQAIRARALKNYNELTLAERNVRRWRMDAKPSLPKATSQVTPKSLRRAAMHRAYCDWSDLDEVVRIYMSCAIMNELDMGVYEVDHCIPLTNTFVAGLHVHHNLRVITSQENSRKGNWLWPQMWPISWENMELLNGQP